MGIEREPERANQARRYFIQGTGFAAGLCALPSAAQVQARRATEEESVASPPTTPFVMRLPMPVVKTTTERLVPEATESAGALEVGRVSHQLWKAYPPVQFYEVRAMERLHLFHPELPYQPVWGYDGLYPGPTFVARVGMPILVRFFNDLPAGHVGFGSPEISVHLHGAHDAAESDGYASDWFSNTKFGPTLARGGTYKDHHYPNFFAGGDEREGQGTLWYHDHRVDFTAPNVYKGLAGFFLLFDHIDSGDEADLDEHALRLPSGVGEFDLPLLFQDRQFDSGGMLHFDSFDTEGLLGDKFCVNGVIQPYFPVKRRKYRLRLLNGSNARFYEFFFVYQGVDSLVDYIANDGNLLPAPLKTRSVRLAMAERADVVIDFAAFPAGASVFIVNRLEQISPRGPTGMLVSPGTPLLRFDVEGDPVSDPSRVPPALRPLPPIDLGRVVKTRTWEFGRSNGGWVVNNRFFDSESVTAAPRQGTSEIWILKNGGGGWWHPIHIHLENHRILSRNGMPPPPHERGRKDVTVLGPGEEVRILMQFRDFSGKYVMHCHNITHEDHAMMVRWDVVT